MLKRKYGNRADWRRVEQRKYSQSHLNTKEFQGYITLLKTVKVKEPLITRYGDKEICIVDNGYMWLQQFPYGKHHSVTTMFDASGEIVQWYIDICHGNGIESGVPWMDDLFLDIVVLPSGEIFLLDEDELEQAYKNRIISKNMYDLAWDECKEMMSQLQNDEFVIIKLAQEHKRLLEIALK
ncbi:MULTISPECIES: DUF402 domain-containing protein [Bacillaceae]|uniref:DUF402 domain-containing protein n=1 Tax=Bacillaceae TaxID=186817 RepID=UPI001C58B493|nr:DUF402 domain-containing protein [Rossellomorea sp. YZS02]MBW3111682.1 DUF402 domain-containing protein [Bacillus sp. MCCB 382]MDX8342187.1 DUF402 domain-containing protein [Rossellomorea sp. YZS02]